MLTAKPSGTLSNQEPSPYRSAKRVLPKSFEVHKHYYPKVVNAHLHPLVRYFLELGNDRILHRFCHLHPEVDKETLFQLLNYRPSSVHWAGCDLFKVRRTDGIQEMIVVETNSCPSGQKSMPLTNETEFMRGYKTLINKTFFPLLELTSISEGSLAVIYDKNFMEASGYAATLAEMTNEVVYLAEMYANDKDPPAVFRNGILYIRDEQNEWHTIRACFRYVTQKPWSRIPLVTKTAIMNGTLACISGGRNKMMADHAYKEFNREMKESGLKIRAPETTTKMRKAEISPLVEKMGGQAVIKVPYSNAGQGVYTITSKKELDEFMNEKQLYDKFIVQSLIGNVKWSSMTSFGRCYHAGTIPDSKNQNFAVDLRMMVGSSREGFYPVAIYARRARRPLVGELSENDSSWDILGTNLSMKDENGQWTTDSGRLLIMDQNDFHQLSLGIDDLIDAYIQSVMSMIAIDRMSKKLKHDNTVDIEMLSRLNPDDAFIKEILLK